MPLNIVDGTAFYSVPEGKGEFPTDPMENVAATLRVLASTGTENRPSAAAALFDPHERVRDHAVTDAQTQRATHILIEEKRQRRYQLVLDAVREDPSLLTEFFLAKQFKTEPTRVKHDLFWALSGLTKAEIVMLIVSGMSK